MRRIASSALAAALAGFACGGVDEAPAPTLAPTRARHETDPAPPREAAPRLEPPSEATGPPAASARMPGISPDAPIPEGTRPLSSLADDVPVPAGARAIAPLLLSDENVAHGTYEMEGSVASATASYTAALLQNNWSLEPARSSGSQALITATKGNRQLSIAIESGEGAAQIVLFEMERPPD